MKNLKRMVTLLVLAPATSATAIAQITAIRAGRTVHPERGQVQTNQIILIERQDIKAIGTSLPIPEGAKIIDLSNKTVMPGI